MKRAGTALAAAAILVWYLFVLLWAVQPLSEVIPVGTDFSDGAPRRASVEVECSTLFAGRARPGDIVPAASPSTA